MTAVTQNLSRALLDSLLQGAVAALLLWVYLKISRHASATARYAAACGALVSLPVAFAATALGWRFPVWMTLSTLVAHGGHAAFPQPALLVGIWLSGAAACALYTLGGWMLLHRWGRDVSAAVPEEWKDALLAMRERFQVRREVRLALSRRVSGPCVWGWMRPVVMVPLSLATGLSQVQLEALLAHELAHVRRHDYLAQWLQRVLESAFFYHPATWWISRQITQEREHCCDDLAVRWGGDRLAYARALVDLEVRRAHAGGLQWGLPLPITLPAAGGSLRDRVARLLAPSRPSGSATARFGMMLGAGLILMLGTGGGGRILGNAAGPSAAPTLVQVAAHRLAISAPVPLRAPVAEVALPPAEPPTRFADLRIPVQMSPQVVVVRASSRTVGWSAEPTLYLVSTAGCAQPQVLVDRQWVESSGDGVIVLRDAKELAPCGLTPLDVWRLLT